MTNGYFRFYSALFSFGFLITIFTQCKEIDQLTAQMTTDPESLVNSKVSKNDLYLDYSIGNRFNNTIGMETLKSAQTAAELIPDPERINAIHSFQNIQISSFAKSRKDWETAKATDENLNNEQKAILQKLGYGQSFSVTGNIKMQRAHDKTIIADTLVYYISILPHQVAEYTPGNDSLISYLKSNSKQVINLATKDKLKPGKIDFNITKQGEVSSVKLTDSSGFDSIDKKMLELIQNLPGRWNSAKNIRDENVAQKLTFFYGAIGC